MLQAPQQRIDAILAEERFAVEGERGNAPVARLGVGFFVFLDDGFETIRFAGDGFVQVRQILARARGGGTQVIAFVPILGAAAVKRR